MAADAAGKSVWLFGPRMDLGVFLGSALLSGLFVLLAQQLGVPEVTPIWVWLVFVLGIDVAHVWSTLFRTYLDREELERHAFRYVAAPLFAWVAGVLLYREGGALAFWRALAYLALFHFVRQQVGWMAIYARRAGAPAWVRRMDAAAIYAATLGPALWWHAHLPRPFAWFVDGDFVALPGWVGTLAIWGHAAVLLTWLGVTLGRRVVHGVRLQPGAWALLFATWIAWFGGIVLAQSDLAFTVMNVTLHGVPYLVFLFVYAKGRAAEDTGPRRWRAMGFGTFALLLLALAFAEEFLWDALVWHERPEVFGALGASLGPGLLSLVVPLLAVPQATHYLLDAVIWRSTREPRLASRLGWSSAPAPVDASASSGLNVA